MQLLDKDASFEAIIEKVNEVIAFLNQRTEYERINLEAGLNHCLRAERDAEFLKSINSVGGLNHAYH